MKHAVGPQRIQFGKAQLQRVVAKNVAYSLVKLLALPRQQILAGWRFQPFGKTYNLKLL